LEGLKNTGVSVVIVTFNGKERLQPTLEHLAKQKNINFNWEVLLIDNNSSDGTDAFASAIWQTNQPPCELRIIKEIRPGTMFARRNGIDNAKYRYLLFCDDDNWFPENYVKFAFDHIVGNDEIAAIGGCGILEFEKGFSKPMWIDKYAPFFGSGAQGEEDGDTTNYKGCLYTAGTILDRVWLQKIYAAEFHSVLKGRDGKSLVAGEDTELTVALKLIGGKLYYYSAMHFKHFMPAKRITWEYLVRLAKGMGKGEYVLRPYIYATDKNLFYEYLRTFAVMIKYYLLSVLNGFREGDDNVIVHARFSGQLEAIQEAGKTNNDIRKTIQNLKSAKTPE
jgi:glycosyltransferase involved in cell wall biosynthesis